MIMRVQKRKTAPPPPKGPIKIQYRRNKAAKWNDCSGPLWDQAAASYNDAQLAISLTKELPPKGWESTEYRIVPKSKIKNRK